jgi:rubrerythrin
MCQHGNLLQRQHRTFWQKLMGVKEVYVCSNCGYVLKIR